MATICVLTVLVTVVFGKVLENPSLELETSLNENFHNQSETIEFTSKNNVSLQHDEKIFSQSSDVNLKNENQSNIFDFVKNPQKSSELPTQNEQKNDVDLHRESTTINDGNSEAAEEKFNKKLGEKEIFKTKETQENATVNEFNEEKVKLNSTVSNYQTGQNLEEENFKLNKGNSAKDLEDKKFNNVSLTESQKVTYNGVKLVRVNLKNKEQRRLIKQMEEKGDINTWVGNGTAVDILVRNSNVFDFLNEKKFNYDVVLEDLQRAIEEENPPLAEDEWTELEGRKGHRMTWQMYHRMNDIYGYLDYLTTTYPDNVTQEIIGYSVEKRPLKVVKISSGKPDSKAIWVDSGIHAREWITPATATYAINQMIENGDGAHGVDWYFLTLVNPDGYEHSHTIDRLWRKNRSNAHRGPCAGTDLNRNFGYRWGGQGSSQIPCRETYAGSEAFSEPETKAIKKFVGDKSKQIKAYISFHSYGQYILYPWGYDRKVPPDYSDLHRVGRLMAQAMKECGGQNYRVGSAAATLYPAAGGADDWAKGSAKIKYTYTIELRDTGRYGFILPAHYIQPTAREAYAALKVLANEVVQL